MRWWSSMVMIVIASCVGDGDAACDGPVGGAAYVGFRWACTHAPPCTPSYDCDDPRWATVDVSTLDAMTACLLGRCEARAPCVADAVTVCTIPAATADYQESTRR